MPEQLRSRQRQIKHVLYRTLVQHQTLRLRETCYDMSQGLTVLHMAAKQNLESFVKLLLDAGADVQIRDYYEVSATATSVAAWLTCGLSFYLQTADIEHSAAAAAPNTIVLVVGNRWGFAIMLNFCRVQQL